MSYVITNFFITAQTHVPGQLTSFYLPINFYSGIYVLAPFFPKITPTRVFTTTVSDNDSWQMQRFCDTVWKSFITMVQHITSVIQEYQEGLNQMPYVPRTSFQRASVGHSGDAKKNFLTLLFNDQATGFQFPTDLSFFRSNVQGNSCGHDMTW